MKPALRRTGLPRSCPFFAFLLFALLVPISHYLTPARFNINMAHQRLWILQKHFPGNWDYRFAFSAIMLSFLLLMDQAFSRWLGRPGARAASPQTASPQPASSQTA